MLGLLGGTATEAHPSYQSRSIDSLRLIEQTIISPEDVGGDPISLSPDGQWIAVEREGEVCVFEATTLTEHVCAPFGGGALDRSTAAWSPYGSRLAFTDQFTHSLLEPDLWVLEAETGSLVNLTDDGVTDWVAASEEEREAALVDLAPAWSPDGREIVFSRSVFGDPEKTSLFRIAVTGGKPAELLTISPDSPLAVYTGVHWAPDGGTILYTVALPRVDDPANGIWAINADGTNPRPVVGPTALGGQLPYLVDMSTLGAALLFFPNVETNQDPLFAVADLTAGSVEPLAPIESDSNTSRPKCAAFSPDGYRILLAAPWGPLIVRELNSGEDLVLSGELIDAVNPPINTVSSAEWATNDLAYCAGGGVSGLLLRLEAG